MVDKQNSYSGILPTEQGAFKPKLPADLVEIAIELASSYVHSSRIVFGSGRIMPLEIRGTGGWPCGFPRLCKGPFAR